MTRPNVRASLHFAQTSVPAAALSLGVGLIVVAACLGQAMNSWTHLGGSLLTGAGLLGLARAGELESLPWRPSFAAFVGAYVWIGVGLIAQAWVYYRAQLFSVDDTGIFADLLANFALRGSYRSETLGVHGFADHFTPTLALLAPLFAWEPTFLWLIGAKVVAFLACPVLLYVLGREVLGSASRWLWAAPCLCLVHAPLMYAVNFEFQPTHLAPPLALFAFVLAIKERWVALTGCLLLTAGLKEDQALVGVCVGSFLMVERRRPRLGVSVVLVSVVLGLLIFLVAMPAFSDGVPVRQHSRFGPLALLPEKALLPVVMLATVGFLPLAAPRTLLFILPVFGTQLMSKYSPMLGFRHHYQAVPSVLIMVGGLYGLRALQQGTSPWSRLAPQFRGALLAVSLTLVLTLNGMTPWRSVFLFLPQAASDTVLSELRALRERLPSDRPIYASYNLFPYLIPQPHLQNVDNLFDPQRGSPTAPHVVVTMKRATPVSAQMERAVVEQRYRVEDVGTHLRLYSSVVPKDGAAHGPN